MILEGDCVEKMRELPEASVDAIVTDPPYGLGFMGKEWDTAAAMASRPPSAESAPPGTAEERGAYPRTGKGPSAVAFPGRAFQAWSQAWATEALRVLKPGGHLLAFGGTRTYHRLACAIEDAGFEIRDTICWMYGSGFPKSLDVSKAIDKAAGAEREVVGISAHFSEGRNVDNFGVAGEGTTEQRDRSITAPATPEAQKWEGYGTALKPAHEPIVLARKPLSGTVAANVQEHGTGALNIDGCRVEGEAYSYPTGPKGNTGAGAAFNGTGLGRREEPVESHPAGRWPANVALDEAAAEMLDAQSGERIGRAGEPNYEATEADGPVNFLGAAGFKSGAHYGDSGGASRFFYCAKASRAERNAGLDGFERVERRTMDGGRVVSEGRTATRGATVAQNVHPTVKPIDLMRWLVRLVTPPGGVILDPFLGSGTTGCAAALEGFDFIGIEREAEYVELAKARIEWWAQHKGREADEVLAQTRAGEKLEAEMAERGQMGLFG